MEDENPDNNNYIRRRPLCVRVKHARVRRILNMDHIEDASRTIAPNPTDYPTTQRKNNWRRDETSSNSVTSSFESKHLDSLSYKGCTSKEKEDYWKCTKVASKPVMPSGQNKRKVSFKGCSAIQTKNDEERTKVPCDSTQALYGVKIEGIIPLRVREDNVKKYTDFPINFEENEDIEEPFSPVVSEYIPGSDSYNSDENIESEKPRKRQRKRNKNINHQNALYVQSTSSSNNYLEAQPDITLTPPNRDLLVKSNVTAGTSRSTQVVSRASTPSSSLVLFKKIRTPDSFKEVLRAVQNQSTKNTLDIPAYSVTAQSIDKQLVCQTTKRNKILSKKDKSYEKFYFVASASVVFKNCDIDEELADYNIHHFVPIEMDENVEEGTHFFQNDMIQLPDLTERQSVEINFIASQNMIHINDENFTQTIEQLSSERKSRKRTRDESSWQVNKNKLLKNSGKRYHSKATKKVIQRKVMGEPCACKNKCNERIDNSERMLAFQSYWELANHERQWDYILKYVKGKPTRVALLNSKRPRTQTLLYSLPKRSGRDTVTVCKKMFLQTLNINDRTVYTALEKQENQRIVDLRGCHTNRVNKISEDTTKSVVDHINMFPRKESHYLRKQTQREYLDEKLNCAKMHRLYLEWIKSNPEYENVTPASERWYYHIFNTKFNIGFFHPKKDLCETCSLYEQADSERKEQLKDNYEKHIKNKELVRKIKDQEKVTSDSKEKTVACFDLEKVLSLPQSEVGIFHYKRKYPVYNFTIYNILTKSGHCYVWHAQIAKRGANEIASCLWSFLQTEAEKAIKEISFYSDNCSGQNRNRFVFALYVYASKVLNIKITHRFLQKGHTQNEGDSMHSCIEKSKKNHVLYVPEEIYALIRNAKVQGKKYSVKEMTQEDIFDFKKLVTANVNWEKDESGNKVNWSKIKEISVDPLSPGKLKIKYNFDDETLVVDTNRSGRAVRRRKTVEVENAERSAALLQLYTAPLPISENLYKDLMNLCKENHIPPHYQTFYKNLRAQSETNVSNSEDEDNAAD